MNLKESTGHDFSQFNTKCNSTVNNLITDQCYSSTLTLLDCTDSPSVSPLNFYAEPMYQPIPIRFSEQLYKKRHEFCLLPRSEYPCKISRDSSKDICKPTLKPIEISSQDIPIFVNSIFSQSDWQKIDCHYTKQDPSYNYRQYDSESSCQGEAVQDAMRMSVRNQYLQTAFSFDATNDSQKNDVEEEKKPVKALSAYNFFFRHERERILAGDKSVESEDVHYSYSEKQSLLHNHWYRDRSQKRSHRKSHGKISFATLSRIVAQRWKELPKHLKKFYQDLAAEDLKRYRHEVLQNESGGNLPHISFLQFCPADQMKDIVFDASTFFDFHTIN